MQEVSNPPVLHHVPHVSKYNPRRLPNNVGRLPVSGGDQSALAVGEAVANVEFLAAGDVAIATFSCDDEALAGVAEGEKIAEVEVGTGGESLAQDQEESEDNLTEHCCSLKCSFA